MFDTLARKVPRDNAYPERVWRLDVLARVLDGTIYDVLDKNFDQERTDGGEYIPIRQRRPSVRYNLSRLVVQDSNALLFGDGHFPSVDLATPEERQALADIIKAGRLAQTMTEAAMRGSTGSVVVKMRVSKAGRVHFSVMDTRYLTPEWDADEPDTLVKITERYKVKGAELRARGYAVADDKMVADFWFQRVWDTDAERWFLPVPVTIEGSTAPFGFGNAVAFGTQPEPQEDTAKTVQHGLGFVPMVWIKNLPGGDDIDGACTFRPAVETQIEIDYQLSQAGRGLKYSSDPLLMIREPAGSDDQQIVTGDSHALVVSEKGDAKLLEIGGTASAAVIEYVRTLREQALEVIHGNRSSADKISAAQSGRALEMLHQALIWLTDQLRASYGENGILPLARMVIEASRKYPLTVNGVKVKPFATTAQPSLRWPPWFPPTGQDRTAEANALSTLSDHSLISHETAVKSVASAFDIEDVPEELAKIAADQAAEDARAAAQAAQVKATETVPM